MTEDNPTSLYNPEFPESWEQYPLSEIAEWINGNAFSSEDFSEEGDPIIKITEIKEGVRTQTKRTDGEYKEKYRISEGDLLFAWSGAPDTSIDAYWWNGPDGWLNQHIFKVKSGEQCKQEFLFYLLKFIKPNLVEIARNNQTTGLGHVRKKDLEQMMVGLPSLSKQQEIIDKLRPLDEKIRTNNRIEELLQETVETLFRYYFVDFEPFDSLVQSDVGEVPEQFTVKALDDVLSFQRGYSYSGDELIDEESEKDPEQGYPMVNLGNIAPGGGYRPENLKYCENIPNDRYLVEPGDLIISHTDMTQDRKILGSPVIVPELDKRPILFSHHLYAIKDTEVPIEFLYYYFLSPYFKPKAESFASGTTVLSFSSKITSDVQIPIPPEGILDNYLELARPAFKRIESIRLENEHLLQLRNRILPKLMSGSTWVNDISSGEIEVDSEV